MEKCTPQKFSHRTPQRTPRSRNDHIRRGKKIGDDVIKLFSVLLSLMLSVSSFVVSLPQHTFAHTTATIAFHTWQRTPALTIEILQTTASKNVSKSVEHVTGIIAITDIETQHKTRLESMRTMLEVCSFQSLGALKSASVLVKRTPLCVSILHNMQFVQERNCAHRKPTGRKQKKKKRAFNVMTPTVADIPQNRKTMQHQA